MVKVHYTLSKGTEHFEVVSELVVDPVVFNIITILDLSWVAFSSFKELRGVILNVLFF